MALMRNGCPSENSSFCRLYEENTRPLIRFFERKGVPAERAQELSQETFLRLYRNVGALSTARNQEGYLFATARNLWCNTVRGWHTAKRTAEFVSLDETTEMGPLSNRLRSNASDDSPAEVLLQKERREILYRAIRGLPNMMRRCMTLSVYRDQSIAEIAGTLGIAEGTVKSHMFHARAQLQSECHWIASIGGADTTESLRGDRRSSSR